MAEKRIWLTRANGITLLRLLAAPALAFAILDGAALAAAALFWFAVATDVVDGRVARRFGETSAWGSLIDHATDASFVACGAAALAARGVLPGPLAWLIAAAFLQYALDSRSASRGEARKSRLGHWNGIAYYVIVATPVMRDALGVGWPNPAWVTAGGWLLVGSTLASMASRLRVSLAAK